MAEILPFISYTHSLISLTPDILEKTMLNSELVPRCYPNRSTFVLIQKKSYFFACQCNFFMEKADIDDLFTDFCKESTAN